METEEGGTNVDAANDIVDDVGIDVNEEGEPCSDGIQKWNWNVRKE